MLTILKRSGRLVLRKGRRSLALLLAQGLLVGCERSAGAAETPSTLRSDVEATLVAALGWADGDFSFEPCAVEVPSGADAVSPTALLLETARVEDERRAGDRPPCPGPVEVPFLLDDSDATPVIAIRSLVPRPPPAASSGAGGLPARLLVRGALAVCRIFDRVRADGGAALVRFRAAVAQERLRSTKLAHVGILAGGMLTSMAHDTVGPRVELAATVAPALGRAAAVVSGPPHGSAAPSAGQLSGSRAPSSGQLHSSAAPSSALLGRLAAPAPAPLRGSAAPSSGQLRRAVPTVPPRASPAARPGPPAAQRSVGGAPQPGPEALRAALRRARATAQGSTAGRADDGARQAPAQQLRPGAARRGATATEAARRATMGRSGGR